MTQTIDADAAIDRVMRLMAIPGKSGEEAAVAAAVREELLAAGAEPDWFAEDRAHERLGFGQLGNLALRLPGTQPGPRRLLMAHLDTVPICVGSRPRRNNERVVSAAEGTGLGADDRAGVATVLTAAIEILRQGLEHPPLTFLWTVQEETGLRGVRVLDRSLLGGEIGLAFNFDGGSPHKITIGATGGYRMVIEITGIASHAGGAPEAGVSAIAVASLAIADLHRAGWHGAIQQQGCFGTSNFGVIHGGEATNVVTDRVVVRAEARSHDATFRERIVAQIEAAFRGAAEEVKNAAGVSGSVRFDGGLDYEAFRLELDQPAVAAAQTAIRARGLEPECVVANGGLDANWMVAHGVPTVTLGCGQMNQHMVTEMLDVPAYLHACEIALSLIWGGLPTLSRVV